MWDLRSEPRWLRVFADGMDLSSVINKRSVRTLQRPFTICSLVEASGTDWKVMIPSSRESILDWSLFILSSPTAVTTISQGRAWTHCHRAAMRLGSWPVVIIRTVISCGVYVICPFVEGFAGRQDDWSNPNIGLYRRLDECIFHIYEKLSEIKSGKLGAYMTIR